jgi:hypothetical protein
MTERLIVVYFKILSVASGIQYGGSGSGGGGGRFTRSASPSFHPSGTMGSLPSQPVYLADPQLRNTAL